MCGQAAQALGALRDSNDTIYVEKAELSCRKAGGEGGYSP